MILPKAELTASGRPKLSAGEVERVLLDKVDVEFVDGTGRTEGCAADSVYRNGYCVVTSRRLLWIDGEAAPAPGRSCALPLEAIDSVHKRLQYGLNLMAPKVRLEVKVHVDHTLRATSMQGSVTFKCVNLRCRGEAPDGFKEQLAAAVQAHKAALEQQLLQQQQQQRQQQQQLAMQQQQQHATPWAQSGPGSGGGGGSGAFSAAPAVAASAGSAGSSGSWVHVNSQQQQQQQQPPGGGPPSRAAQQGPGAAAAAKGLQAVDAALLAQLVDMGFPRPRVMRALLATNNSEDAQAALDWLLAAGADPAMDAPVPFPEPAVVSRQELQRLQQMQLLGAGAPPQQQQQAGLAPGWGVGSVGAAAAAAAAASGASGSWSHSSLGPMAAAMAAAQHGGGSSPRRGGRSPLPGGAPTSGGSFGPPPPAASQQQQQLPGSGGGGGSSGGRVIGVAGIMSREAEKNSQAAASLATAFQDLNALMGMAAEMVALAERFRGVMGPDGSITLTPASASSSSASLSSLPGAAGGSGADLAAGAAVGAAGAAGGSTAGDQQLLLDAETQLQLIAMGITSPVTRASAGARYQQELCRQLADFLEGPLARGGGLLMLPDAYCLFNRARGTELVSPDDLLQACEAFPQAGLPLRLRKFPSGVIVIQGSQFSDAQLCRSIEALLQRKATSGGGAAAPGLGPALSAADVSAALTLPLTLAREALLVAEAAGVLCRDDGPEGLRFFRNFFANAATQPVALPPAPVAVR